jgi:hypothetical protein
MSSLQVKMFLNEEVESVTPDLVSNTYTGRSQDSEILIQASNSDCNFGELGLVSSVFAKHKHVWDFRTGEQEIMMLQEFQFKVSCFCFQAFSSCAA